MAGQIISGGRLVAFYRFTNGTSPTLGVTLLYSFGDQITSDITIDSTGAWQLAIDQIQDDEAMNTFYETEKDYTIAGVEQIKYEDGVEQFATSNQTLLAIVRGGLVSGGASAGKQKVGALACILDLSSGAWKQEGSKYNRPKILLKSVAIQGSFTIPATYFNSFMVTPAAKTMGTSTKYGRTFFG